MLRAMGVFRVAVTWFQLAIWCAACQAQLVFEREVSPNEVPTSSAGNALAITRGDNLSVSLGRIEVPSLDNGRYGLSLQVTAIGRGKQQERTWTRLYSSDDMIIQGGKFLILDKNVPLLDAISLAKTERVEIEARVFQIKKDGDSMLNLVAKATESFLSRQLGTGAEDPFRELIELNTEPSKKPLLFRVRYEVAAHSIEFESLKRKDLNLLEEGTDGVLLEGTISVPDNSFLGQAKRIFNGFSRALVGKDATSTDKKLKYSGAVEIRFVKNRIVPLPDKLSQSLQDFAEVVEDPLATQEVLDKFESEIRRRLSELRSAEELDNSSSDAIKMFLGAGRIRATIKKQKELELQREFLAWFQDASDCVGRVYGARGIYEGDLLAPIVAFYALDSEIGRKIYSWQKAIHRQLASYGNTAIAKTITQLRAAYSPETPNG